MVIIVTGCSFYSLPVLADIAAAPPPSPGYQNAVSFGISKGVQNDRDANFYGWSVDYSRHLHDRWSALAALMWDTETERFSNKPDEEVDSYTVAVGVSYALTDWANVSTGFGKGIANTDNSDNKMQFSNGDLSTGLAFSFTLPGTVFSDRGSLALSFSYEYNISAEETSVSADLVYGWSF